MRCKPRAEKRPTKDPTSGAPHKTAAMNSMDGVRKDPAPSAVNNNATKSTVRDLLKLPGRRMEIKKQN
jgi:hypothetical protein